MLSPGLRHPVDSACSSSACLYGRVLVDCGADQCSVASTFAYDGAVLVSVRIDRRGDSFGVDERSQPCPSFLPERRRRWGTKLLIRGGLERSRRAFRF
jgi:hypothetical protein